MSKKGNRFERMNDVIEMGKQQGMMLSYDQIEETFGSDPMTEVEMEQMEEMLQTQGIRLIEGDMELEMEELTADSEMELGANDRAAAEMADITDPLHAYLSDMSRYPLLTQEEEQELARRSAAGDMEARHRLVNSNLRLVVNIAKRYRNRGMDLLDLIQMGNEGLMRGISKFDPEKGNRLSTYSTWWIRQAITRGIYENSRTVRIPVHMSEKLNRYKTIQNTLSNRYGRDVTVAEVEREYAVTSLQKKTGKEPTRAMVDKLMRSTSFKEEVRLIRANLQSVASLDMPVGEKDDDSMGDFIADEHAMDPETAIEEMILKESLDAVLGMLPEREAQILRWRYLDEYTLEQCGQRMNVTRERVRQLESKAIRTIRNTPASRRMLQGFCNVG